MLCLSCSQGLVGFCSGEPCELAGVSIEVMSYDYSDSEEDSSSSRSRSNGKRGNRKRKSGSQSSGRKEAARQFPLDANKPCEWQGLASVGGGNYPILGCPVGAPSFQQARHHGPEKNVQNNEQGNVHRICHYCHYRWHAANDPTYDWNAGVWPPHSPRPLTSTEQTKQTIDYMRYMTSGRRKQKVED